MKKIFSIVICIMALLFAGCEPNAPATSSKVVTGAASDITTESVVLHGVVNVDISQYDDVEFGMMISEVKDDLNNRDGEMYKAKVLMGKEFKLDLKNLSPETEYYYCAWVFLNNTQYEFGDIKKFTTLAAPGVNEITILTGSAEDLTYNSVVLYGELEANFSDYTSIKYGISYSLNKSDLQSDNGTLLYCSESLQDNKYSVALSGLSAETKYYYCSFVYLNEKQYKYGEIKSFTTLDGPQTGNHEYVDLGLSVKWATCNVGATKPEEYGDYFAWGETEPKDYYNWSTYKWCNGSYDTQTKYCTKSSYGTVDNKTQLELSDDAARANWGGSWRMPTHEEQYELRENCTWTWTTQNGVNGYKVTSKKNGNSIFLPAAGYRNDSSLYYAGSYGYSWSSSLRPDDPSYAYGLLFRSYDVGGLSSNRGYGQSVRPVCQ